MDRRGADSKITPMSENHNNGAAVDLAIIGGGPTGLFGAFYAGLRGMSVKIIDSLEILGGQLTTLYPEKYIYDVGGFSQILAKDLSQNLVEQAIQYKPAVCLGQRVERLVREGDDGIFRLHTNSSVHPARSILIAAGVGAFEPKTLAAARGPAVRRPGFALLRPGPPVDAGQTRPDRRRGGQRGRLGQHGFAPGRILHPDPSPRPVPRPRAERSDSCVAGRPKSSRFTN